MTTYVAIPSGTRPTERARVEQAAAEADIVEVWGQDSFPASDPPANW